jgi:hypothetical protein
MLRRGTVQLTSRFVIARNRFSRTFCSDSSSSAAASSSSESRLHSTDIAFKPAESGWGSSKSYSAKWDSIFGSKSNQNEKNVAGNEWGDKVRSIEREIQALPQEVRESLLQKFSA